MHTTVFFYKLRMQVVDNERKNPIIFGSGVKGQGQFWHSVYKMCGHDTTSFWPITFILHMHIILMILGTLLILGHGVKGQVQLWHCV